MMHSLEGNIGAKFTNIGLGMKTLAHYCWEHESILSHCRVESIALRREPPDTGLVSALSLTSGHMSTE